MLYSTSICIAFWVPRLQQRDLALEILLVSVKNITDICIPWNQFLFVRKFTSSSVITDPVASDTDIPLANECHILLLKPCSYNSENMKFKENFIFCINFFILIYHSIENV